MPVYNGGEFLENSINSIVEQTLKDVELICINDGSTDNSLDLLNELSEKYSFIKVYSQENQGSGKARNYGLSNAKGEYIAFLDADDIFVDNNALEEMYEVAQKHDADMVGGNLKRINSNNKILANPNYKNGNYKLFTEYGLIHPEEYGVPWAFYKNIYKADFLSEHNIIFPDLKRGQDPVFLAKILTLVDAIYTVPVTLYGYNYSIAGKPENKINTYEKKLDYLIHFKQVIDVLDDGNLKKLSHKFKKVLISYLKLAMNENDFEVYEIFNDIFSNRRKYFKKFNDQINYFESYFCVLSIRKCNSEEEFNSLKKKLYDNKLWANYEIDSNLSHELILIFSSESFEDYVSNKDKFVLNSLELENKNLLRQQKKLKKDNKKLKKKWKTVNSTYKSIINSKSWSMTRIFRKN